MKALNISICGCGKVLDKHSWRPYSDLNEFIAKRVRVELPKAKVTIPDFEPPLELKEKKEIKVKAVVSGKKEQVVPIMIKLIRCNLCEKEGSKYFEAILQIRSKSLDILEDSVRYLQERVHALRQRGVFINKVERFDDGFDLYITSNKLAQVLGRELLERYGGKLKISPRLFSKSHLTSKDIYRVNVFIELPEFTRGDFIISNERVYVVEKLGRKIKLTDMANGAGVISDYDKLDYRVLRKQQAYVSKTYPHLEVINPHDFQSSMVKNKPKNSFAVGQTVNVVIYKGIYVVE